MQKKLFTLSLLFAASLSVGAQTYTRLGIVI